MIAHNEFNLNTETGVELSGRSDVRIWNNTFYSATGDNIRIEGNSSNVEVQNNILWADGGYDIYVANDSEPGFYSDYNDLNAGPGGSLSTGPRTSRTYLIGRMTLRSSICIRSAQRSSTRRRRSRNS